MVLQYSGYHEIGYIIKLISASALIFKIAKKAISITIKIITISFIGAALMFVYVAIKDKDQMSYNNSDICEFNYDIFANIDQAIVDDKITLLYVYNSNDLSSFARDILIFNRAGFKNFIQDKNINFIRANVKNNNDYIEIINQEVCEQIPALIIYSLKNMQGRVISSGATTTYKNTTEELRNEIAESKGSSGKLSLGKIINAI